MLAIKEFEITKQDWSDDSLTEFINTLYAEREEGGKAFIDCHKPFSQDVASELIWYSIFHCDKFDSTEIIEMLIQNGFNPSYRKDGSSSLLYWASIISSDTFSKLMVEHGVDPNALASVRHNQLPLNLVSSASRNAPIENFMYVLSVTSDNHINHKDDDGRTPVMSLVSSDRQDLKAFNAIMQRGADVRIPDNDGCDCLLVAAYRMSEIYLEKLLEMYTQNNWNVDWDKLVEIIKEEHTSSLENDNLVSDCLAIVSKFRGEL